jgi:hypothetical protein
MAASCGNSPGIASCRNARETNGPSRRGAAPQIRARDRKVLLLLTTRAGRPSLDTERTTRADAARTFQRPGPWRSSAAMTRTVRRGTLEGGRLQPARRTGCARSDEAPGLPVVQDGSSAVDAGPRVCRRMTSLIRHDPLDVTDQHPELVSQLLLRDACGQSFGDRFVPHPQMPPRRGPVRPDQPILVPRAR